MMHFCQIAYIDDCRMNFMTASINTSKFDRSSDLQQVIHMLETIKEGKSSAYELAAELRTEEQTVKKFLEFMQNLNWIREENRRLWIITEKGNIWLSEIENVLPPT